MAEDNKSLSLKAAVCNRILRETQKKGWRKEKILQKAIARPMDTASVLQKGTEQWLTALEGGD